MGVWQRSRGRMLAASRAAATRFRLASLRAVLPPATPSLSSPSTAGTLWRRQPLSTHAHGPGPGPGHGHPAADGMVRHAAWRSSRPTAPTRRAIAVLSVGSAIGAVGYYSSQASSSSSASASASAASRRGGSLDGGASSQTAETGKAATADSGDAAASDPVELSAAEKEYIQTFTNRVLRHDERVLVPSTKSRLGSRLHLQRIDVASVPSNAPIEDQHTEQVLLGTGVGGGDGLLLCMLDGHWDPRCGRLVARFLPQYIAHELKHTPVPRVPRGTRADGEAVAARHAAVSDLLTRAFTRLDADLLSLPYAVIPDLDTASRETLAALPDTVRREFAFATQYALTGACAAVALVDLHGGPTPSLYVANTGDARVVLASRAPGDTTWLARALTQDQQPGNPDELARMKREHPGEEATVAFRRSAKGPMRVIGGMMPSRSFGDAMFKWPLTTQKQVLTVLGTQAPVPPKGHRWNTSRFCYTPPYMTARPEVQHCALDMSHDHALVLATDGIFDRLSTTEAVETVVSFLQTAHKTDDVFAAFAAPPPEHPSRAVPVVAVGLPATTEEHDPHRAWKGAAFPPVRADDNSATHLIRSALDVGQGPLHTYRDLAIPPPMSRNRRDDMTVQVAWFLGAGPGSAAAAGHRLAPPEFRSELRPLVLETPSAAAAAASSAPSCATSAPSVPTAPGAMTSQRVAAEALQRALFVNAVRSMAAEEMAQEATQPTFHL